MADNQTHHEVLTKMHEDPDYYAKRVGTGIFIVPTFKSGKPGEDIHGVPNISYEDCRQWGQRTMAFKWVPDEVASYEKLLEGCPTQGRKCQVGANCGQPCVCNASQGWICAGITVRS